MVGYPSIISANVEDCLGSIADKCTSVQTFNPSDSSDSWKDYEYTKPMEWNELIQMESGYGYWMYVTQDCSWVLTTV
jgi:hypothetical protein